ncbi:hypothetical protein [Geovibrio ferrireducens]|uniref:hypothetical protein n=1 Tax=Geovibrio ferrireducens TaxID=46201 RepID=UPI00224690FF|nr:hypothetical protein [Geovibrio ferrireducens]
MMVELTVRVAYSGMNQDGKPDTGMIDVHLTCDREITVDEAVAAAKMSAKVQLKNAGFYDVMVGSLYSARAIAQADNQAVA